MKDLEKISLEQIARDIVNDDENSSVLYQYYKGLLIGGVPLDVQLYLDLQNNKLFENAEASCNSWLSRDDGTLVMLYHHNNYGCCFEDDGSSDDIDLYDCGYLEFLWGIEEKIVQAMEAKIQAKIEAEELKAIGRRFY